MTGWHEIDELPQILDKNIYFEDKKFKAPLLANDIIFNLGVNRGWLITDDDKKIWRYNGRYYEDDGEEKIRNLVQEILGNSCNTHYKNEVVNWVKDNSILFTDREILDSPEIIGFENGVFDLSTMKFKDYDGDFYWLTSILPVTYDSTATCPTFKKFLEDVLYPQDVEFIQEYIGYCLYRKYTWSIMTIFLGHGRNGNTTLVNTITKLLWDKKNVEHMPLQLLAKDVFARARLYGKWANLCSDIGDEEIERTGLIKELTGGDYIFANIALRKRV